MKPFHWALAAAVVLAVAAGAYLLATRKGKPRHQEDVHRRAMDGMSAALYAPEGATPCETAFNAIEAVVARTRELGQPPVWLATPDRPTYLTACNAIAPADQRCLQPRYHRDHGHECNAVLARLRSEDPAGTALFALLPSAARNISAETAAPTEVLATADAGP